LCTCSHFITVCSMIFPSTSLPYPLMIFHHVAAEELGHFLTHSGLMRPEVSSVVFLGSFCLLGCSFYQSG
jgi:hypothetical protein